MIATSQALASAAGLKALQDGGNAIDAAITAAGGPRRRRAVDERHRRRPVRHRLGREDEKAARARRQRPFGATPRRPRNSPGAGSSRCQAAVLWPSTCRASSRAGVNCSRASAPSRCRRRCSRRSATRATAFPCRKSSPTTGTIPRRSCRRIRPRRQTFLPNGQAPRSRRDLRRTRGSPKTARAHRQGRPRRVLQRPDRARDHRRHAGAQWAARRARLHRHTADWVDTISTNYRGYRRARDAAEHAGLRRARDAEHPRGLRHQGDGPQLRRLPARVTEAKKIAFADRAAYLADRDADAAKDAMETLLSKDYAAARRKEINMQKTGTYRPTSLAARTRPPAISTSAVRISATRST